jgi:hypothetical protein
MTYLELVNKILVRLREPEVTSVQDNPYSKLIGEFVNIVKREVEDTYNWSALRSTISVTTTPDVYSYILTDSTTRLRIFDVHDDTNDYELRYQTTQWFDRMFQSNTPTRTSPMYYNLNGVTTNGDQQVDLFPIPDGAYVIRFNIYKPQPDLVEDLDVIQIPFQPVVEGALARAISERGDDGGYTEQEGRYNRVLSDLIAIESGNRPDESIWYPV